MKSYQPLSRLAVSLVAVSLLFGCAAFNQGLKDASEGIPPNPAAIPEGQQWFCYAAPEKTWSGCWRTQEECTKEREANRVTYSVDTLSFSKWGSCQPALQAFCSTFEMSTMQSDGSAKMEPFYLCYPDDLACAESLNAKPKGAFRMSTSCAAFK